ncbi:NPCBM/NEW2 domain-containing protein [Streptomyces sp.]
MQADVTGATQLRLRAADANDGNHYDHSEWADARLTC